MRVPPDQSGHRRGQAVEGRARCLPGRSAGRQADQLGVEGEHLGPRRGAPRRDSTNVSRKRVWASIEPLVSQQEDQARLARRPRVRRARRSSSPAVRERAPVAARAGRRGRGPRVGTSRRLRPRGQAAGQPREQPLHGRAGRARRPPRRTACGAAAPRGCSRARSPSRRAARADQAPRVGIPAQQPAARRRGRVGAAARRRRRGASSPRQNAAEQAVERRRSRRAGPSARCAGRGAPRRGPPRSTQPERLRGVELVAQRHAARRRRAGARPSAAPGARAQVASRAALLRAPAPPARPTLGRGRASRRSRRSLSRQPSVCVTTSGSQRVAGAGVSSACAQSSVSATPGGLTRPRARSACRKRPTSRASRCRRLGHAARG